jgi:NADH-quinone oxidoreductase subunit J
MNALFFWLFSAGMIICALGVVFNRNAVASALCFAFSIVFMAGLFVMLSAFFLAAVQILVTAGAVMVLFLFIIMLLDLTAMEHTPRPRIWTACSIILALAFLGLVVKTLATIPPMQSADVQVQVADENWRADPVKSAAADQLDDTHRIGRMLFNPNAQGSQSSYIAPFEITSLLILVATIGVIVLCKQDERPRPYRREAITREAPPVTSPETALKN